jgi:hypothetical protein
MARYRSHGSLFVAWAFSVLVLLPGVEASAADGAETAAGTPAILAALEASHVTVLDDSDAMTVRGQGSHYRYVLVRILGLNTFDFAPGLDWTWNPFGYRYGAWGGPGWSNGGMPGDTVVPADAMDALFRGHDLGDLNDLELLAALATLPSTASGFWGLVYVPSSTTPGSAVPTGNVWVSGRSLLGGRLYSGWRPMPAPEYFRRQAVVGMSLLTLLP